MSLNLDKSRWTRVKFGEVVFNVNATVRDAEAAGIDRVIAMDHLDPGELRIQRWGNVEDGTTFTRRVKPGQTLFGKRRAYQRKVAYAEFDAICSGDILTFQANEARMLPELLPFLVQSDGFFTHALGTSAGSLSPRTNWTDLSDFEFELPPLDEQKRLADLLWAIENHSRALSALGRTLQEAKSAFIDDFLQSATQRWPIKRLAELTTKITDGVHKRPNYVESGIPFLTVENLTRGKGIDFSNVRYVSYEDHTEFIKRTKPERGDVLVSKDGTLGVARVVQTDIEFSIFVSLALLKPIINILNPDYLRAYFDSNSFRSLLAEKTSGSALKHIHLVDFRATELPMPTYETQIQFVAHLETLEHSQDSVEFEVSALSVTRSSVLSFVFGGSQ